MPRRFSHLPATGLSEQTPEAVLKHRIDAAFQALKDGGHGSEAWVIRLDFKKRRWRMLVEFLEFMELHDYDPVIIRMIRNYRPPLKHQEQPEILTDGE